MTDFLGYTKEGKPIFPCQPDRIYTACVISCACCGEFIRGMGGPMYGAVCRTCYQLDREVPDGACNPASPAGS